MKRRSFFGALGGMLAAPVALAAAGTIKGVEQALPVAETTPVVVTKTWVGEDMVCTVYSAMTCASYSSAHWRDDDDR